MSKNLKEYFEIDVTEFVMFMMSNPKFKYPEDFGRDKVALTVQLINEFNTIHPAHGEYVHYFEFVNGLKRESEYRAWFSSEQENRRKEILTDLIGIWLHTHN